MTTTSSPPPVRLVLWDIDQTLIDAAALGADWYRAALAEATGMTLRHVPEMAGKTERAIASEVLRRHEVGVSEENLRALFTALIDVVEAAPEQLAERGRVLPGAVAALRELADSTRAVQTVVTGNLPAVAEVKLAAFALRDYLDVEIGGFGADSVHRHELIAHSVARAGEKHGREFVPESVVVIGDTPHDVAGALHHGAIAVGVATGRHDEASLRSAGAHVVLADLADTDAVLAAVHG